MLSLKRIPTFVAEITVPSVTATKQFYAINQASLSLLLNGDTFRAKSFNFEPGEE